MGIPWGRERSSAKVEFRRHPGGMAGVGGSTKVVVQFRHGMSLDLPRCEALVETLVAGDVSAWRPLMVLVGPAVLGYAAASKNLGHRRTDEDAQQEVLTTVLERLRRNEFRAFRTYLAWKEAPENEAKSLEDWLRIVTSRVACDFVSHHARRSALHTLGVALETGVPGANAGPGMTNMQAIREVLEHANRALPPDQADVVQKVYAGKSIEEIALLRGESKATVEKCLHAAHARLRRWASDDSDSDTDD